jgi:hypothetical protein
VSDYVAEKKDHAHSEHETPEHWRMPEYFKKSTLLAGEVSSPGNLAVTEFGGNGG